MKFMKLGSKPDQFHSDGDTVRYVATELETDMVINVGDVKFYLHKFPLLSKSSRLQKLVSNTDDETNNEIDILDIPGGPSAFEICAKFCYGMVVTLNAYNVVAARCAAEYLQMYETVDKGNLVYKIDVFLTSSIFRSWKDSIIVLQTTKSLLLLSEELKIVSRCLDSIASRATIDLSKVDWSYTYNRKKLSSESKNDPLWNGVKKQLTVPRDWWVEDICELQIDLYKRVITTIRAKGKISSDVIGESLKAYALKRLPGFSKGTIQGNELLKYRYLVDTITWLLPEEKNSLPCSFLLKLLQASMMLECNETGKRALIKIIGKQLDEATIGDIRETILYNIDIMHDLVEKFVMQEHSAEIDGPDASEFKEICIGFDSEASKIKVARLVDCYLFEAAKDSSLTLSRFVDLAEMVSSFPRSTHDGLYRAIDMYLKEHQGLTKSEKKRICQLMDCRKLSPEACAHAVQNERLPMRVIVQVLFFEQARAEAAASGSITPDDIPSSVTTLVPGGSYGSSRSLTTNTDEDYDGKPNLENVDANKVRKIFSRFWSSKERRGENSSSDTSESPASTTPSRSRRYS
ncbi:hypothetical protein ACJIZ3_014935 [Penstemon smallii]|uniref:Uncharacterized protein n=1 Tax=Penstemon smallii TaxID=265156 RepID=A0ABD3RNC9_9LAMI